MEADKKKCRDCGHSFYGEAAYKKHVRMCRGEDRKHKCASCKKRFYNRSHLREHLAAVHKVAKYFRVRCKKCTKGFYCQSRLKYHTCIPARKVGILQKAKSTNSSVRKKPQTANASKGRLVLKFQRFDVGRRHSCMCGWTFTKWELYRKHVTKTHLNQLVTCWKCRIRVKITSATIMEAHMKACFGKGENHNLIHSTAEKSCKTHCEENQGSDNSRSNSPQPLDEQRNGNSQDGASTLRSIITSVASKTQRDRIEAFRDVLDKRLSGDVTKKIASIFVDKKGAAVTGASHDSKSQEADPLHKNPLAISKHKRMEDSVNDTRPGQDVSIRSSEDEQHKSVSPNSNDSTVRARPPLDEGSHSSCRTDSQLTIQGTLQQQLAESFQCSIQQLSTLPPRQAVQSTVGFDGTTRDLQQTRASIHHQTRLCHSCKKIYTDANFYAVEPEDLCECSYRFVCKLCNVTQSKVDDLRQHLVEQHSFLRCVCGLSFANKLMMESHRQYGLCPVEIVLDSDAH